MKSIYSNIRLSVIASFITLLSLLQPAFAQTGVKIAATPGPADASAILDLTSSNKGLLFPRVALVGLANATSPILNPATGLVVYNLGTGGVAATGIYFWNGTAWVQLTSGGLSGSGTANQVTKFTGANSIGNSILSDDGTNVNVGTSIYGPSAIFGTNGSSDTRATNPFPETFRSGIVPEFKQNSTNGLNDGGSYNGVLSFRPYSSGTDFTGGGVHQLGFTQNGNLWQRYSQTTGSWGTWISVTPSTTFTIWGRNDCPATSTIVYAGYVAGGLYTSHPGNGSNTLCLTKTPDWTGATFNDVNNDLGLMYGAEWETGGGPVSHLSAAHDYDAECAECLVQGASVSLMVPGATLCPTGWTRQYWGYLLSNSYAQLKSTFVCGANNPMLTGSNANSNGTLWYSVETEIGSLRAPYIQNRELTCVVCTK